MLQRLTVLIAAVFVWFPTMLRAGISPENVIVVVNSSSQDSRTVANHYVALRKIPSQNVVFLDDVPANLKISLEDFKSKILVPVLTAVNSRGLASHTRVIAYSAGFPTAVDIKPHTDKLTEADLKRYQLPTASLTGLTYLYHFVLADNEHYLDWGANLYARGMMERSFVNPYVDADRRAKFEAAEKALEEKNYGEAAAGFEEMFEKSPSLPPLAIRAAEARKLEGDERAAKSLIVQAIRAGWQSGRYLNDNETLQPLLDDAVVAKAIKKLRDDPAAVQGPIGFASDVAWTPCGWPSPNLKTDGIPYMLSCMLAVVHERGSTVDQAVEVLRMASEGDRTHPKAKFWFANTADVRCKARFPGVAPALLWLGNLGYDAEVTRQVVPNEPGNCAGLMLGTPTAELAGKPWKFVPGAIVDNLTSTSAAFDSAGQTKITTLLHAGAAMSCGPVYEPFSLPFKFPTAMTYGYYASGVAAIEAFYLTITSPYQLLVVGDPIAQPFAEPPTDWIGVNSQTDDSGKQQIAIKRRPISSGKSPVIASIELFIEGRLVRRVTPMANININLPNIGSGVIETRTVLVGNDRMQPRITHVHSVRFGDGEVPVATTADDGTTVHVTCEGAESIRLMHHASEVGSIEGGDGDISLDRTALGEGPIRIRPVAMVDGKQVPGEITVAGG